MGTRRNNSIRVVRRRTVTATPTIDSNIENTQQFSCPEFCLKDFRSSGPIKVNRRLWDRLGKNIFRILEFSWNDRNPNSLDILLELKFPEVDKARRYWAGCEFNESSESLEWLDVKVIPPNGSGMIGISLSTYHPGEIFFSSEDLKMPLVYSESDVVALRKLINELLKVNPQVSPYYE